MKIIIVDSKNERQLIEIDPNDNISILKEKIKIKKGINNEIYLHFNGTLLEDNEKVEFYDIEEKSIIMYTGTFRAGKNFKNIKFK